MQVSTFIYQALDSLKTIQNQLYFVNMTNVVLSQTCKKKNPLSICCRKILKVKKSRENQYHKNWCLEKMLVFKGCNIQCTTQTYRYMHTYMYFIHMYYIQTYVHRTCTCTPTTYGPFSAKVFNFSGSKVKKIITKFSNDICVFSNFKTCQIRNKKR